MDKTRNYILDRLKSQKTSIEEFNYDHLQAPPLSYFLSPYDIQQLHAIATSVSLSAKPQIRYQEIDKVMRSRGLVKFASGTNRVVYRHPEFSDILFKVASDAIGMGDNPAEFQNQFFLKPFVAKMFEHSPCGTVAIVERVVPITSREEFLTVIDDVYEVINEWLIGEYVLADIGTKFFMNWATRRRFGPVLIDYPYVYKLDGSKLYCSKNDPMSLSGRCDGLIDYDDGFNFLVCTKCGAIYKAKELEHKITNSELIVKRKGEYDMNITISGGSKNIQKVTVNTGDVFNNPNFKKVVKTTSAPIKDKVDKALNNQKPNKKEEKPDVNKRKEDYSDIKITTVPIDNLPKKNPVDDQPVKTVNGVSNNVAKNPVSFSSEVMEEAKKESEEKADKQSIIKSSPIDDISAKVNEIIEILDACDLDTVKSSAIDNSIKKLLDYAQEKLDTFGSNPIFLSIIGKLLAEYTRSEEDHKYEIATNNNMIELVNALYTLNVDTTSINVFDKVVNTKGVVRMTLKIDDDRPEDEAREVIDSSNFDIYDDVSIVSLNDPVTMKASDTSKEVEDEEVEEDNEYKGICLYDAKTINAKDIVTVDSDIEIIVPITTDGSYLKDANSNIIAIDTLDNKSVGVTTMVSLDWFNKVTKLLNDDEPASKNEDNIVEEIMDGEVVTKKEV